MSADRKTEGLFDFYADAIARLPERLSERDVCTAQFLLHEEGSLKIYYAPFDYVNKDAKIALVGITPGAQQMAVAFSSAQAFVRAYRMKRF